MTDHNPELARKVARAELSKRAFVLILALFVFSFSGVMAWGVYEIRKTQTEGTPTGKRIVALAETTKTTQDTLLDCVQPTGECYKRSRQNQADIVATLNLGAVYAVYCVDRNPQAEIAEIQACVAKLYESGKKQ